MIKLAAQVVPLKTNAEKAGKELAKKYGVQGFPTILFLTDSGDVFGRIGGYMPPKGFAEEMTKAINLHKKLPEITAKLKEKPDDGEANAWLAALRAAAGKRKEAEECLAKAEKSGFKGPLLARAYNAIGDSYQTGEEPDKAIAFFKKADVDGTESADRAYAKVSIMFCLMNKGDKAEAKKVARQILDMKDVSKDYVDMANKVLKD